jgi:4-hydroxy-3-polyprenylbenzoate decarboxylase
MQTETSKPRRLIVAMTGASGAIYGLRLLELLHAARQFETHLLISAAGEQVLKHELNLHRRDLEPLADKVYDVHNIGAAIASGSYKTEGMIVAPCSMKTLSAIAHGYADNLIIRAADVVLKERRKLVLLVRETPLNLIHLRNMTTVTEAGGIIFPPVPAFYQQPASVDDIVLHSVKRILGQFDLSQAEPFEWCGLSSVRDEF